jgi:hypothetical protein
MKQKAKSLLTLVSLAFLGIVAMLAIAAPAQAAPVGNPVVVGTVSCQKYSHTSYPNEFWNCDPTLTEAQAANVVNGFNLIPTKFRTANFNTYKPWVFKNPADYTTFTGKSVPAKAMGDYTTTTVGGTQYKIAAAFHQFTQHGVLQTITHSMLRNSIAQTAGRIIFDTQLDTNQHQLLTAAMAYDVAFIDDDDPNYDNNGPDAVWPSIDQLYPGSTSGQILSLEYGATEQDVFAYTFATFPSVGGPIAPLNTALGFFHNTKGIIKNYIWDNQVTNEAKAAQGTDGVWVLCAKFNYYSGSQTWPNLLWNCVHPYNGNSAERTALDSFRLTGSGKVHSTWRSALQQHNVQIHVMRSANDWNRMFGTSDPVTGVYGLSTGSAARTAIFQTVFSSGGGSVKAEQWYQYSTDHELAHQLDYKLGIGGTVPSQRAGFSGSVSPGPFGAAKLDEDKYNDRTQTSCFTAIDQFLPVSDRLCPTWEATKDNKQIASMKGIEWEWDEHFARAFARKLGKPAPQPIQGVQSLMQNSKTYMDTAFSTGVFN